MKKSLVVFLSFAAGSLAVSSAAFAAVPKPAALSPSSYRATIDSDSASLEDRWMSVIRSVKAAPKKECPGLTAFLKRNEWFLRNAAVIAAKSCDRPTAVHLLRMALHDKALVVRSSAVKALKDLRAKESKDLLWEKLNSNENFRRGQSLWIRPMILEALRDLTTSDDIPNYIAVLNDKDSTLHPVALTALKDLTGQSRTRDQWLAIAKK